MLLTNLLMKMKYVYLPASLHNKIVGQMNSIYRVSLP